MKIRYLIIVLLFLTGCSYTGQYTKTYDNSKNEYFAFFKLGCIAYLHVNLLPWNTIDYIGPRVFVYFKSGRIFDYDSSCIIVKKPLKNVKSSEIKTVTPSGVTI